MKKIKKGKLISIILVVIIACLIGVKTVIIPNIYDGYINSGMDCFKEKDYKEAVLYFDKAIKIQPKSTTARVLKAKAYLEEGNKKEVVSILQKAQNIDKSNEDLLIQMLEILVQVDGDISYEFLKRYVDEIGEDNLSKRVKELLDDAFEKPQAPKIDPSEGKYTSDISIKLHQDNLKVGYTYFYTIDGKTPSKEDIKYTGDIHITKSTTVKIIGYNKSDKNTGVITLEYIIDKEILNDLNHDIEKGKKLIKNTEVGSKTGNIYQDNMDKLKSVVDEASDLVKNNDLKYEQIEKMKKKLKNAINDFNDNIINPVDKSELEKCLGEASILDDYNVEGTEDGQYKEGSKKPLLKAIEYCENVYSDNSATQDEIDEAVSYLKKEMDRFMDSKITKSLENQILNKYVIYDYNGGIGISKFTQNTIIDGYFMSEGENLKIISRREEGNNIFYKTRYGEIRIGVLGNGMIDYNGAGTYRLLSKKEFLNEIYITEGEEALTYDNLSYFGITRSDIDDFYN